ncbi:MAG: hypothetical protein WC408_06710 [Candidatus Micrarchaeia archaeon]|jgi:hypothetical protein
MLEYLVIVGALVNLLGASAYILETLKGNTKPNRITWLMWSTAPLIASFAAFSDGVTWAALPVFMAGFCPLLILISSFANKKAYWKLETFDYICGFFSLLALVLWALTNQPNVAIVFAIISDAFAAIPTLRKAWAHPQTESHWIYVTGIFNAITALLAVNGWAFSEFAFATYLVIINGLLLFSIFGKKILMPETTVKKK